MKCEEVEKGLIAYLDRRASSSERRDVEEHLASCAACQTRAEEFRKVWSVLDEMPAVEPTFGFDARVRQRVAAEPRRGWFDWFVPQVRLALSAALLIALTVWIAKRPPSHPGTTGTTATTSAPQQQDFNAIENLGVLENFDVVTKMDALSDLAPAGAQEPDKTQPNDGTTND
ncbi:MAG TPA: zf-HC2 domain-containing protein [Candidatus Acidoferrales bacterium]|nr:zf-HC2 domain-containing protein [Candidatus Acidoferrales bacterium]